MPVLLTYVVMYKLEMCDGYEHADLISQASKTATYTIANCKQITRRPLLTPLPLFCAAWCG